MRILDACLGELTLYLREPLMTAEAFASVSALARAIPPELAAFYLECRLSPPAPEVDLLAGASRPARGGAVPVAEPLGPVPRGRIHDVVTGWLSGSTLPHVQVIWLEVDESLGGAPAPFANVHLCVDRGYAGAAPGNRPRSQPQAFDPTSARLLLENLTEASVLSASQGDTLERCLAQLPPGGRLVHISSMAGRTPVETKAYVALPQGTLATYAAHLGGTEWAERLEALDPWAAPELNGSTLYCDITFRGNICQSVGLVFSQPQIAEVADDPSRGVVRKRLIQEGLSTLAQDAALAAWMEPPNDLVFGRDPTRRVLRWLDLKVTRTLARLTSKAYLGFAARVSLF